MIDFVVLEIERLWSKEPGWFATLDRERQTQLLAWHRVHCDPTGDGGKRRG